MSEDERLREALHELQLLRDREAQILDETQALLDCLEAYSSAQDPVSALNSIFLSLRDKIGAVLSLIVVRKAHGYVEVRAGDDASFIGAQLRPPVDLFARSRNIYSLPVLGDWSGSFDASAYGGCLVALIDQDTALISVRKPSESFRKSDYDLARRLAGLAAQALINRDINVEKDLLAATISGSSSGFAISDATHADQPLVYVNQAFERLSGFRADEVLGRNCRFLTAEAPDSPERRRLRQAVADRAGGTFLLRNQRKSGALFWNELTLYPVKSATGEVQSIVATQTDVTARVEAAEQRDHARARMERAFSATEDAFLVLERDLRVAVANAAVNHLFPATDHNWAVGSSFADNWASYLEGCRDYPGEIPSQMFEPDLAALCDLATAQEVDLPDGRSVLLRASRLDDGGIVLSATNVTAMKSAQHLLSQRLAAIEAAQNGIVVTDDEGRIVYLNTAAVALLGYKGASGGLGKRWWRAYYTRSAEGLGAAFEVSLARKAPGVAETHEITGSPLEGGGSVLVIRDISENLAVERREAEMVQELSRLQRQQAIAQLTAGIAHDFNNLLAAINGSATLISLSDDLVPSLQPHVDRINAACVQSAKLISRLLDVGGGSDKTSVFDLASNLDTLPELLGTNIPQRIAFDIQTDGVAHILKGNSGVLNQVLVNMILNARDAIGDKDGRITLDTRACAASEAESISFGQLDPTSRYLCLRLTDTGAGMSPEMTKKVFQPFFTTKGRLGTGLGLATAALQVQAIGGAIGLDTEPGRGTSFRIYWPLAGLDLLPTAKGSVDLSRLQGLSVIVVDDDPNVAAVISSYLEAKGLEVAVCQDPRDALDAIREDPDDWHAVVTDYDMPIMNGGELTQKVRALSPDMPIIVVTALAQRLSDPRLIQAQTAAILAKPIDLEELSRTLAVAVTKR